jgi:hypothetical protein
MKRHMILSVGMPRAGTGWFHNITKVLVIASGGVEANLIRTRYHLGRLLTEVNCNIGTITSYRLIPVLAPILFEPSYVIKLHGGRKPLADLLNSTGLIKSTFIYRDPRDAALSIYEYGQTARKVSYVNNDFAHIASIEEAIDYITPYIDIARGWINSPHTFVVRYEEMFTDFDGIIRKLLGFLDIQMDLEHALSLIEEFRPGVNVVNRRFTHFKKGKVGRHLEKFTPAQLQMCQERFGDFLQEQGFLE